MGAGKSKKLAKRQAANKMIQVDSLSNQTKTVACKVLKHDLQRLRDAPVENEDAFQHIDDDMLAQVIYKCNGKKKRKRIEKGDVGDFQIYMIKRPSFQGLSHVKEASLKAGSSHSQQVSRFHKNLKGAQVSSYSPS